MNNKLKQITELFKSMPGISTKISERLAIQTIEDPQLIEIMSQIIEKSHSLKKDELTGLIIPEGSIANENKEKDILLILETNKDVNNVLNKTHSTKSIFILDMKNKRDFKNTENLLKRLFNVISEYKPKEVLFLLTPSIESELIMRVVKEEIIKTDIEQKPELTRLSMGIPFGGSIEFSDERTIREAMNKREKA